MGEFRMPALGVEMVEGRVDEWLVAPGDEVHRGDVVAVVDTDKAAIEVEVWEDGLVEDLVVPEGVTVPVGAVIARLQPLVGADEGVDEGGTAAAAAATPVAETHTVPASNPLIRRLALEAGVDLTTVVGTGPGGRITRDDVAAAAASRPLVGAAVEPGGGARRARPDRAPSAAVSPAAPRPGHGASPYARRLAAARGVDLSGVRGTGPAGAIIARDLVAPADAAVAAVARRGDAEPDRAARVRAAVARTVERSNREIPHYYVGTWVDVTSTLELLEERNLDRPPAERVLFVAHVVSAVARALAEHPALNGHWVDGAFVPSPTVDLGIAVALRGGGLVTPAIARADELSIDEVMAEVRRLVRSARRGTLRGAEVAGPSATLTSLGDLGVETVYGVILPPQVAIVGVGRPVERPWVVDGEVEVRTVVHLTLSGDHRQSDGLLGARLLERIGELLGDPDPITVPGLVTVPDATTDADRTTRDARPRPDRTDEAEVDA